MGSRYSPDYVCTPFKTMLGNMIEALEAGANTLIMNTDFIKGVFVPIITPIDADEKIDEANFRKQIDYIIDGGLRGKDTLLFCSLCVGGVGGVCTAGNFMPELTGAVYEKYVAGDLAGSLEAQFKLNPVRLSMDAASFPVAGHDCMELNLSGAHAPYFTRNIVILTDSSGNEGVGEVPGGEKITEAIEAVQHLVVGTRIADYKQTLNKVRAWLDEHIKDDVRGLQTFDLCTGVHVVTAIEAPLLDLMGKFLDLPAAALMGDGVQRERVQFLSYLFYVGDRKKTDLEYEEEPDAECDWYRLRHEEAMTPEAILALAKATHEW